MAIPLTSQSLYESAREFAESALEAHRVRNYRRVSLDAGTALEHLAKACLAKRSPVLLVELKGEANFPSLLNLLGMAEGKPRLLRTVSLRDALTRVRAFVSSNASDEDLRTLVELRDGTVHAAQDDEVEERIVVAFVQHADALVADLGGDRGVFWGAQLTVIDALLADASDKVAHRVQVKVAAARVNFERLYGAEPPELVEFVRKLRYSEDREAHWESATCPACSSTGMASGEYDVDWDGELGDYDPDYVGSVAIDANWFLCRICGLRLESTAELAAAGMTTRWVIIGEASPSEGDVGEPS